LVHLTDEVAHPGQHLGRLRHHHREPVVEGFECGRRRGQDGDLDDDVFLHVETRHLQVHPHQHVAHGTARYRH
jgi:hypothetical protein